MYRVLIADDEPIERQVISKKLNGFFKDQIEIFLAANGVEAVEKMFATEGPYILECAILENDDVLPMTPPGMNVDDMMLEINV